MNTEQLANLLVSTVEQDLLLSSKLYFSTHVELRNVINSTWVYWGVAAAGALLERERMGGERERGGVDKLLEILEGHYLSIS